MDHDVVMDAFDADSESLDLGVRDVRCEFVEFHGAHVIDHDAVLV